MLSTMATACWSIKCRRSRRSSTTRTKRYIQNYPATADRRIEEEKQQQQQQTVSRGSGKEGSIVINARDVDVACSQKSFLEEEACMLSTMATACWTTKRRRSRRSSTTRTKRYIQNYPVTAGRRIEEEKQQQQQTASRGSGKEGSVVVNAREVNAACSRKNFLEEEADELQHAIDDDVRQIKKIIDNKKEEGSLCGLLRCLQSMKLPVSTLVATGIKNSVRGVERHRSSRVRQLARAVLNDWAKLSSDSLNITKVVTENIRDTPDTVANPWDNLWPNFPPLDEGALRAIYCHPLDLDKLFSENPRESHKSKRDNVKRADKACNKERKQENDCENLKPNCTQDSTSEKRNCGDDIDQSEPMSISAKPHNTPSKRIKIIIASSKHRGRI